MNPFLQLARSLDARKTSGLLFFDSSRGSGRGRRSYLMANPTRWVEERAGEFWLMPANEAIGDIAGWIQANLRTSSGSEQFESGWAGMLSYEFAWRLESIQGQPQAHPAPEVWIGEYDTAFVWDHDTDEVYWTRDRPEWADVEDREAPTVCGPVTLTVSDDQYRANVQACVDAIYAGELFEVNYTERFVAEASGGLFWRMRERSTGNFFALGRLGDAVVCSVSPEQFIEVSGRHVSAKPIKGTRPMSSDTSTDLAIQKQLLTSEKDRAENIMIVDLMRNDLTRVCELGTVKAETICALETFEGIHHLVSTVVGELSEDVSPIEALLACFPAGSITGAPKIRAIELMNEIEATPRGPYTGTMFILDSGGYLNSSVLIRTATVTNNRAEYGAGGAVVSDSIPQNELDEAYVKARPFMECADAE